MSNEESKLRKAIEELTKLPQKLKEGVINFAEDSAEKVKSVFTRKNVVNAIMPKFFGRGVNKLLDIMSDRTKKVEPNRSAIRTDKPASETDDETDIDLVEELLDTMDEGFTETNENLTKILKKLGGEGLSSNNSTTPLLLGYSNKTEESTAEFINVNYEVLDVTEKSNETLAELLDINGQIAKTMQAVEKNTRVDSLKQREDEIEARKARAAQRMLQMGATGSVGAANVGGKGGIMGAVLDGLVNAALGYAGIKAATGRLGGKVLGGVKGAASSVWQGVKGAAGGVWQGAKNGALAASNAWKNAGDAKGIWGAIKGAASRAPGPLKALGLVGAGSAVASATPAVSSTLPELATANATKVGGAVAPAAAKGGFLQGAKSIGAKALGAPLTVGIGAYEAYNVSKDEKLSPEQKTIEYSKIGGKTAGALAGAKAGAMIGAIGGPIGAAIGGVIGGIGGYFLGEKGGEVVGDVINAVAPSNSPLKTKTPQVNVSNTVKPNIGTIQPGQTKTNNLQFLTQQIEQTNAEKQDMKANPTIVPIAINNQSNISTSQGSDSGRTRTPVPLVRNQDGTIQRLLDLNYHPLLT